MSDSKNAAWIGKAASLDGKSWCYRVTVRLWSQQWNVYWRWVVCLQSMKICNEYFSRESIRVAKITPEKYYPILQKKKAHCPIQCGWIFSCQGAVCSVLNSLCFSVSWCVLVCLPWCAVFGMQSVSTSRVYLWPPLSCLRPSGASLPAQASSLRYFVFIWNNFVEYFSFHIFASCFIFVEFFWCFLFADRPFWAQLAPLTSTLSYSSRTMPNQNKTSRVIWKLIINPNYPFKHSKNILPTLNS